jgi:hypothetical protein
MDHQSHFDMRLKELEEKATGRLLMADVFSNTAFDDLYSYACEKAVKLKTEFVIPRQYLASILDAANAIRSRAEYLPEVRLHLNVAQNFDVLLGLIAKGEAPEDKKPGVPRIL